MKMEEKNMQTQIDDINRKLDVVLEYIETRRQKNEAVEDLIEDASIVAKDIFKQSVVLLEKSQVEIDSCGLTCLVIKILQNVDTFHEMLDLMESARDFMKDVSPIVRQMGLDAVNKLNELDRKGYFEYFSALGSLADRWITAFPAGDLRKLEDHTEEIAGIFRNLTTGDTIHQLARITDTLATLKMDDAQDNISYWKLFRRMRSPEVRKSLSYSLRLLTAINQKN
jgi:uncharacterized protein YjgD (DUF1641 family)